MSYIMSFLMGHVDKAFLFVWLRLCALDSFQALFWVDPLALFLVLVDFVVLLINARKHLEILILASASCFFSYFSVCGWRLFCGHTGVIVGYILLWYQLKLMLNSEDVLICRMLMTLPLTKPANKFFPWQMRN